jgi:hypothetical protein
MVADKADLQKAWRTEMRKVTVAVLILALNIPTAHSQSVSQIDVMKAQDDLIKRVNTAAAAFARAHNISPEINYVCSMKMANEPSPHVNDGSIPFGVNYYSIADQKKLDTVIYAREVYETIYRKTCMAETTKLIGD